MHKRIYSCALGSGKRVSSMTEVSISTKHQVIVAPADEQLTNLFPDAKRMKWNNVPSILLPHELDITVLMRNLKYNVPAPINSYYNYPGRDPFEVQRKTCSLMTLNKRAYVLNGLGTGKTSCALWAWDYLNKNNQAGKLIVFAPLSTLDFTWANEIFRLMPHRKCVVLHGTMATRLKRLADPEADIFICNHHGVTMLWKEILQRKDIDTLVIDEIAAYRNGGTVRSKSMRKLSEKFKYVWGMSGGPTPNSPTDVWGEAQIVTPWTVPEFFGRIKEQLLYKVSNFKWVPKADAVERAASM